MDAHAQTLYAVSDGLRQRARTAAEAARAPGATDADRARAFALFGTVGLLLQQARAAGLSAADVGLGGFNPDLDALGPRP